MKQAYFASLDRSSALVNGSTSRHDSTTHSISLEFRPCAASSGVTNEQLSALTPLVRYQPPSHANGTAPVSLALLHTPTIGRVLSHGTQAPAADGLPSHCFTHVLLDVPATLDAHQAIQTWGSDQWQKSAADGLGELSDALIPPVSVELDDASLTSFLSDEKHRECFQFMLAAILSTSHESHIFVAAPSKLVALCVYGLTRTLPASMLETLTFSTYEHAPLESPARIVGTVPDTEDHELPPTCYDGAGVGINYYTGTKTSLDQNIPFVDFAMQVLSSGNFGPLDDFRATWQRLGLRDNSLIDVVYRLGRGPDAITKDEAIKALQDSALASWVCTRTEYQHLFLNWALEDVEFATGTFPRVVNALRQKPDHLNQIAKTIHEAGLKALQEGDITRTRCALEVMLPVASPASGQGIWNELLNRKLDPEALTWDMRSYLIPKFTRLRPLGNGQSLDTEMSRWLKIPAEKLRTLLGMSLSQGYQVATCMELLKSTENLGAVAQALSANRPLAMVVLQQLITTPEGKTVAPELFAQILKEEPQPGWLHELFNLDPPVPASILNRCIGAALDEGPSTLDPVPFVKEHGAAILERLDGQSNLDRLAGHLLNGQAGDLLENPAIYSFFLGLESRSGISGPVEERLKAILLVNRYFETPTVRPDQLNMISLAMQLEPKLFGPATNARLLRAALSSMGTITFQDELVALLLSWGPLFNGPSALYRECLKQCQESKYFWKQPDQIQAFLAVALDGTTSEALNAQTEGLEAEAYSLVENMVRRGGRKAWDDMNARMADWPRAARRQWQFLSQAVLPANGRGVSRDIIAGLVGGGVVAVIAIALKVLGVI